jgi:hypothetical protein
MRGMVKVIFGFTFVMVLLTLGVYIYIGVKVVDVIENPKSTGESIGKYVDEFEEGIERGRGDISTYDTINKN